MQHFKRTLSGLAAALHLSVSCCADVSAEGGPLSEEFDPKAVPAVWMQLANETVRFPLRMADMAVRIGPRRQLFVDNYLIADATNVRRQVHQPVRSKHNPMFADQPVWWLQHVLMFDESPRFRMWYNPGLNFHRWKENQRIRFITAYAFSDDGVNWTRPDFTAHKIAKYPFGNVVLPYGMMHGLFYEPWEKDPSRRFKALVCVELREDRDGKLGPLVMEEGYYLHWSPDGIHWEGDLKHVIIPSLTGGYAIPQGGIGDTTRFWWDPVGRRYMGDVKWVIDGSAGKARCRGIMSSDDLIHWSRPQPTFYATEPNIQIYGHAAMAYEGMFIGFRRRTPTDYFWQEVHAIELALDCSRDGLAWTRVGAGQLFMERNLKRDTWDADQMAARSAFVVGEEIWLYYNGGGSIGMATLRRDGFVSLNGGATTGVVVTRPLTFQGTTLHVNARIAEGGELRVGWRSRDGDGPIDGLSVDDCLPLAGDSIDMTVAWRGGAPLRTLAGTFPRLEFRLRDAKIFSFWFE